MYPACIIVLIYCQVWNLLFPVYQLNRFLPYYSPIRKIGVLWGRWSFVNSSSDDTVDSKAVPGKGSFLDQWVACKEYPWVMQRRWEDLRSYLSMFCKPDTVATACTHDASHELTCRYSGLTYNSEYSTAIKMCWELQVSILSSFVPRMDR